MFVARSFRRKSPNVSECDQGVANFPCLIFMFIPFRMPILVWQTLVTGSQIVICK